MRTRDDIAKAALESFFHQGAAIETRIPLRRTVSLSAKWLGLVMSLLVSVGAGQTSAHFETPPRQMAWEPIGLSGGGAMFTPAISPADPNWMMLNCDMSGAYLSEDGGRNWRMIHHAQLRSDIRCRPCFHPTDPKTLYASSGGQLRISRDRGRTFTPIGDLKGARTLYAGVFMEGVYKSTDDGKTWTLKRNGLGHPENRRVSRVSLHRDGSLFAMVYAMRPAAGKPLLSEGVGLYRSKDGGETWQKVNASHPFLYPKEFTVHPKDSNRILVGVCDSSWEDQSGGLYTTADGGQTWQRIGRQGPQTFGGYFHPRHEGWIYMTLTEGAPGAGLWLSQDNGRTWKTFDELPFSNIQRITFDPSDETRLYVTTFGGSVWRGPVVP